MTDRGTTAIRWIVLLAITIQVAVPLAALAGPRPSPFGWQMFTAMAPVVEVWTEADDGSLEPVAVADRLVHPRPEADIGREIVKILCADATARAVIVESGDERTRIPC